MKKYLPSKKFIFITGAIIALIGIFFIVKNIYAELQLAQKNKIEQAKIASLTIEQLVQKDTDGDGVPDWEEALWGTDPNKKSTFDGVPDANYIAGKKKSLNLGADSSQNPAAGESLTETEKFAREFFSTYAAAKQSGQIDSNTINNISAALGQKITDPSIIDQYSEADIKIGSADDADAQKKYLLESQKLFVSYQKDNVGDELGIIADIVSSYGTDQKSDLAGNLAKIGNDYQDFAKKLIALKTPPSISPLALNIANDANNTGIAVNNMAKAESDPIVGLSGLAQYEKYSQDLIEAVNNLKNAMITNGIITQ